MEPPRRRIFYNRGACSGATSRRSVSDWPLLSVPTHRIVEGDVVCCQVNASALCTGGPGVCRHGCSADAPHQAPWGASWERPLRTPPAIRTAGVVAALLRLLPLAAGGEVLWLDSREMRCVKHGGGQCSRPRSCGSTSSVSFGACPESRPGTSAGASLAPRGPASPAAVQARCAIANSLQGRSWSRLRPGTSLAGWPLTSRISRRPCSSWRAPYPARASAPSRWSATE